MVDVFLIIDIAVIMTCDLYQNIFRYELSVKLTLCKTSIKKPLHLRLLPTKTEIRGIEFFKAVKKN